MNYTEKIITRFAPSPTGLIHIGNIRTALFNWLYAKKMNGVFLIRIDDTDVQRNLKKYTDNIFYVLNWLGIKSNEKIIFQSKNYSNYKDILQKLINENKAYKCFCSKERLDKLKNYQIEKKKNIKYDRFCKENKLLSNNGDFVIRFFNNDYGFTEFDDQIKGKISISNSEFDDFILAKNNFMPTYNLASVVDDINNGVTDIIRGEDHISNTPKQINLMKALNSKIPRFAHLPMILDEQKKLLSKRNKASDIMFYKKEGFLSEAVLNYIIKLGWSYKDKEIFSLDEMINLFDIKNINKSKSIINIKKLIWLNRYYIKNKTIKYIKNYFLPIEKNFKINYNLGPGIETLINFGKNRSNTLKEIITENLFFYTDEIKISDFFLKKYFTEKIIKIIFELYKEFKKKSFFWIEINVKILLNSIIDYNKILLSEIATPLRIIITGNQDPKPIYNLIFISGRVLILKKFTNIIKIWGYNSNW